MFHFVCIQDEKQIRDSLRLTTKSSKKSIWNVCWRRRRSCYVYTLIGIKTKLRSFEDIFFATLQWKNHILFSQIPPDVSILIASVKPSKHKTLSKCYHKAHCSNRKPWDFFDPDLTIKEFSKRRTQGTTKEWGFIQSMNTLKKKTDTNWAREASWWVQDSRAVRSEWNCWMNLQWRRFTVCMTKQRILTCPFPAAYSTASSHLQRNHHGRNHHFSVSPSESCRCKV